MIDYMERSSVWVTPRGKPVEVIWREGTSDWNTVSSVLTHDEYGLRDVHIEGLALDIGAHIGSATLALLADNPDLHVSALECVPENVALLRRNLEANSLAERATVIEGAAGAHAGKTVIHYRYAGNESAEHHAFIGNTALHKGAGPLHCPSDVPHEHVTVPTVSLRRMAPGGAQFAKMDCEGGEWEFLRSRAVSGVSEWVGEWHPTDGHVQEDLTTLLAGFALTFSGPDAGPQGFRAVAA